MVDVDIIIPVPVPGNGGTGGLGDLLCSIAARWDGVIVADMERERSWAARSLRPNAGPGRVFEDSDDLLEE